jgi:hypothetical protein
MSELLFEIPHGMFRLARIPGSRTAKGLPLNIWFNEATAIHVVVCYATVV